MATFNIEKITAKNVYQAETITVHDNISTKNKHNVAKIENVLHLVGERSFGDLDEQAIVGSNLTTTRINSKATFLHLLNKQNTDQYLHFSGHSNETELIINGDVITCIDFGNVVKFNLVVLASCKSNYVAECFAKISNNVVYFLDEIENLETSQLTKEFWQNIQNKSLEETVKIIKQRYDVSKYVWVT